MFLNSSNWSDYILKNIMLHLYVNDLRKVSTDNDSINGILKLVRGTKTELILLVLPSSNQTNH